MEKFTINNIEIGVFLGENASLPEYAHIERVNNNVIAGDYGLDVKSTDIEYNEEGDFYIYHTGLYFDLPEGTALLIYPRSSNRKTDAYLCNHVGVVDWTYKKEVLICFKNRTSLEVRKAMKKIDFLINSDSKEDAVNKINELTLNPMEYAPYNIGDKIAQFAIIEYKNVNLVQLKEMPNGNRDGFGSTGN